MGALEQDALCGYRLHDADAATNKMLALAGRSEVRDFVDVLHLHETYQVPVTPDPDAMKFPTLIRHHGSVRGAWPTVTPVGRP
jgi:hypothetical protein